MRNIICKKTHKFKLTKKPDDGFIKVIKKPDGFFKVTKFCFVNFVYHFQIHTDNHTYNKFLDNQRYFGGKFFIIALLKTKKHNWKKLLSIRKNIFCFNK